MDPDSFVAIGEASRLLKVHPTTLKNWERRGAITAFRDGRGFRLYRTSEVEALRVAREPRQQEAVTGK